VGLETVDVGVVIDQRYRLLSPIGRGGMGAVWRAEHVALRTPVAVKLLDPAIAHDAEAVARFRVEAQAAAALRSPHVVQILDFGVSEGTAFLVMELLDGESLDRRLLRGPLSAAETCSIVADVARALAKAHAAGVVHRDIKPANVFLARTDEGEVTKLLDFGIAKVAGLDVGSSPLTRTGAMLGTPRYMSPEQLELRGTIDGRTDQWALAVVAFECLVGRPAFQGESFGALVVDICARPLPVPSHHAPLPAELDRWFARAAAREPADRFPSAQAMAAALPLALGMTPSASRSVAPDPPFGDAPTLAAPATPVTPVTRWRHGDERTGFSIFADRHTRTLRFEFWGLWDLPLAEQFREAVLTAYRVLEPVRPWVALSDSTRWVPQRAEVQEVHKQAMALAPSFGFTKAAILVNSALSQMQIRRLFEEAKNPAIRFFQDERDALAWIER
jgi:serine/threonine-protein kinase